MTTQLYVLWAVSELTAIGLAVPVAALAVPPFLDRHVAVYFGVASALPLACALMRLWKLTRNLPDAVRAVLGVETRTGAPTTIGADALDGELVPRSLVAVTVQL